MRWQQTGNSVWKFFEISAETPILNRARLGALLRQVPLLYGLIVVDMLALIYTHVDIAPAWQALAMPAVLIPMIIIRAIAFLRTNIDDMSDHQVHQRLRGTFILAGVFSMVFTAWSLSLLSYGDVLAKSHVAFFICVTVIGCVICLVQLPQATVLLMVVVLTPTVIALASIGSTVFQAMAVNIVLVASVILALVLRQDKTFVGLVNSNLEMAKQSQELALLNDENMRLANRDVLTDLPNRRRFFTDLKALIAERQTSRKPLLVGVLDLDGFKLVNDLFGHPSGDLLLIEAAQRMRNVLDDDIFLARLGGDEFGIIIPDLEGETPGESAGKAICEAMRMPFKLGDGTVQVAATVGFAAFPEAADEADRLFERADYALCYSKQHSKGEVALFSDEHESAIRQVSVVAHQLNEADLDKELSVAFQPIIDADSGTVVAFEALARWNNHLLGAIPPSIFIKTAEQIGQISVLTATLLQKTLAAAAKWPENIKLSFNLSAHDLCSPETVIRIVSLVEQSAIAPSRITFEITETALMQDYEKANDALKLLHNLGCLIALDDFGTGFSSLSYVQRIDVDRLKVDRSFVQEVDAVPAVKDIVKSIVDLCRNLNITCIIEGVETDGQLATLRAMGCRYMQGFYFSKPLSEDDALLYLAMAAPRAVKKGVLTAGGSI